jgi:hypothetical protein
LPDPRFYAAPKFSLSTPLPLTGEGLLFVHSALQQKIVYDVKVIIKISFCFAGILLTAFDQLESIPEITNHDWTGSWRFKLGGSVNKDEKYSFAGCLHPTNAPDYR